MRQAASLRDVPLPMLLPGMTVSTDGRRLPAVPATCGCGVSTARAGSASAQFWTTDREGAIGDHQWRTQHQLSRKFRPASHARRRDLHNLGVGGGTPVAMMLRNDFAFFEVAGGRRGPRQSRWYRSTGISRPRKSPTSWPTAAPKSWSAMPTLLPQIREGLPGHLKLLVVTTPPEIATAFNVAAPLTHTYPTA